MELSKYIDYGYLFLKFRVNSLINYKGFPLLLVNLLLYGRISMFILIDFQSCQILSMFYELQIG